jgi:hypothetical protein
MPASKDITSQLAAALKEKTAQHQFAAATKRSSVENAPVAPQQNYLTTEWEPAGKDNRTTIFLNGVDASKAAALLDFLRGSGVRSVKLSTLLRALLRMAEPNSALLANVRELRERK